MLATSVCVLLLLSATGVAAVAGPDTAVLSDVTLPRRTDAHGQHLSAGQRHFEAAASPPGPPSPSPSLPAPPLLYALSAFGRRFQISLLRPEASFLGPELSAHHVGRGDAQSFGHCFYSGTVRDVSDSQERLNEEEEEDEEGIMIGGSDDGVTSRHGSADALLSVCGGLGGSFQHGGRMYVIRPLVGNRRGNGDSAGEEEDDETMVRPHLITRSEAASGGDREFIRNHRPAASHHHHDATDDSNVHELSKADGGDADNNNNADENTEHEAGESNEAAEEGDEPTGARDDVNNIDDIADSGELNNDHDYDDEDLEAGVAAAAARAFSSSPLTVAPVRTRRFVSSLRYLSVMLVADESMARTHGARHVEQYLLGVAARAARLYSHASLDNAVRLRVAGVVVLSQQQQEQQQSRPRGAPPTATSSGGLTLRNFCEWQKSLRRTGAPGAERFDTAVLFTRVDICGASDCTTLGVADVGTVCDPARSCAVIEDDGVHTAFTLAHELGHLLGLPHDDSRQCGGSGGSGVQAALSPPGHIMGETLTRVDASRPWSTCSARHLTDFLDNGHGDCLKDNAKHGKLALLALPHGALLSHDAQCRAVFGADFRHCALPGETPCAALWCRNASAPAAVGAAGGAGEFLGCQTRHSHWEDGTPCGTESQCSNGQCVASISLMQVPVDGAWGAWGPWTACSRTCGGGVQLSSRGCDDPEPQHGGAYCVGQRVQYRSCSTQPCGDSGEQSFRDEQCAAFNSPAQNGTGGLFPGGLHPAGGSTHWRPKYAGVAKRDRCKLVCQLGGSDVFAMLRHKVVDGTPCWPDNSGVCVQGKCVRAGCDHVIGSRTKTDKCGVCGGNGSTCRKVSGSYNRAKTYGYNTVVTIPAGATSVEVKQRGRRGGVPNSTYLAVRGAAGVPYLMSERDIPLPGGALLLYSGSSGSLERLQSYGTLREPVTIQALLLDPAVPLGIKYSFFVPKGAASAAAAATANSGGRKTKEAKGPAGQKAPKRTGKNT